MLQKHQDVISVLRFELNFLKRGGYGRSAQTPWRPATIFVDSLTCPNFHLQTHSTAWQADRKVHPCRECALFDFVPPQARTELRPCHHIPLNDAGQSLASLDRGYNHQELEETVIAWLERTIAQLEHQSEQETYPLAG